MTEKIIGFGLFLTVLLALLWIAADFAVQPALGEADCKNCSAMLFLMELHEDRADDAEHAAQAHLRRIAR